MRKRIFVVKCRVPAVALASLALAGGVAAATPSTAAAYYNAFNCDNWPKFNWCMDPTPSSQGGYWHNWTQAEIENLDNILAGFYIKITNKSGWQVTFVDLNLIAKGGTFYKDWGTQYSGKWPVRCGGQHDGGPNGNYSISFWEWCDG